MSKIIFPLSKDYSSTSLEVKEAQVQASPVRAQFQQAHDALVQAISHMDASGPDPDQPFYRVGRMIKELEELLKTFK